MRKAATVIAPMLLAYGDGIEDSGNATDARSCMDKAGSARANEEAS
jgi:hypothetical protein